MAESANYKVILKKKQIPLMVEFCLDESIEFTVKQQAFPDTDWDFEIKLKDVKAAVLLGMYLRENRIEVDGIDQQRYKRPSKKAEEKSETSGKAESSIKEEKVKHDKTVTETEASSPSLL